eukprot:869512-Pelagomonas_calceolata.AAC.1
MTSVGQHSYFKPSKAVRTGGAISMNDSSADLRYRLHRAWREVESMDPGGNNNNSLKLATY